MKYFLRIVGFSLSLFIVLLSAGLIAGWFPLNPGAIISFAVIFIALYLIVLAGYALYFKKTAGSYDAALREYREKQKLDKEQS